MYLSNSSDLQGGVLCQYLELGIQVQHLYIAANGDRGDQTVDELAHGVPPVAASPIERCCSIIVHGFRGQGRRSCEEPPQLMEMLIVASAGEHFHANSIAGGDLDSQ